VAATDDFEAFVKQRMAEHSVAGAAVALVEDGSLKRVLTFGVESGETGAPVTEASVFGVGSISKPVAAWGVMRLVQAGELDLDTPVDEYLRGWHLPESEFDRDGVTIRRLLSHTAGLALGGYPGFPLDAPLPDTAQSLAGDTNGAGSVYLQAEPGSGFSYSGGGYTLLQLVVEEHTGKPFDVYVAETVLTPLRMSNASYAPNTELASRVVEPHDFSGGILPNHHFRAQAAASLHATAEDLGRFVEANLNENPVLSPDTVSLMRTGVADARGNRIGLGFFIYADGKMVGHGGANFGWRAEFRLVPEDGKGIAVLTNSESGDQLTQDIVCFWDKNFGGGYLQPRCEQRDALIESVRRESRWSALAMGGIATLILVVCMVGFNRGRLDLPWPPVWSWRTGLSSLLVLAAIGWWLFIFTPLGVLLVSGTSEGIATIHYTPIDFAYPSAALGLLILVLAALCLVRKKSPRSELVD